MKTTKSVSANLYTTNASSALRSLARYLYSKTKLHGYAGKIVLREAACEANRRARVLEDAERKKWSTYR